MHVNGDISYAVELYVHATGDHRDFGAAAIAITLLVLQRIVPTSAGVLVAALLLRTIILLTSLKPTLTAKHIGFFEAALGCLYLGGLTLAYHFG